MTRSDAEALIKETAGDLCARLYRRADGMVLTEDCPIGLGMKITRFKRRVSWAVAGALSFVTAWGQDKPAVLSGAVDDPAGGKIPDSRVTALNLKSGKKVSVTTDRSGQFRFEGLEPGQYDVIAAASGFRDQTKKNITLSAGERKLQIVLQLGDVTMGAVMMTTPQDLEIVLFRAELPSKLDDIPAKPKP